MKRGNLIPVVLPGAYGKPRPALVIQSDLFDELPSLTVLPITSDLRSADIFRILVRPSAKNGLHLPSQVMVDKATTIPCARAGDSFGELEPQLLKEVDRSLAIFLGLA